MPSNEYTVMLNEIVQQMIVLWNQSDEEIRDEAAQFVTAFMQNRATGKAFHYSSISGRLADRICMILNCGLAVLTSQEPEFTLDKY